MQVSKEEWFAAVMLLAYVIAGATQETVIAHGMPRSFDTVEMLSGGRAAQARLEPMVKKHIGNVDLSGNSVAPSMRLVMFLDNPSLARCVAKAYARTFEFFPKASSIAFWPTNPDGGLDDGYGSDHWDMTDFGEDGDRVSVVLVFLANEVAGQTFEQQIAP